jgi:hypothetical protein
MTTKIVLDERGDLTAPPGSAPWAVAVRLELQYLVHKSSIAQEQIDPYLSKLEETKGYEQLTDRKGKPFKSALEFYEYPKPFGLGNPPRLWERIGKLRKHGGDRRSGKVQGDYNHLERGTTGKPYILARLARDHPDILAAYERGEYRSARQAGIAAGFVKDVKRIQVLPDPGKIATKLKERLTSDQIDKLIILLLEQ